MEERRGGEKKKGASPSRRHPEAKAVPTGAVRVKGRVVRGRDITGAEEVNLSPPNFAFNVNTFTTAAFTATPSPPPLGEP
jgi:hypothetical protein